jgi:para-nitrobenzyl esterase
MWRWLMVVACLLGLASPAALGAGLADAVNNISRLGGIEEAGVLHVRGIPYAAPPVGALRWQAPQLLAPFAKPALKTDPPRCPQSRAGLASGADNEDCLYLNLLMPAVRQPGPLPVFVYVHGGGAVNGAAREHDGSRLALASGAAIVTINYRLGALGFLASPLLQAPGQQGNFALLDVMAALQWVHAAAPQLGLDANNITLGGESAGGTLVCALLAVPRAKGLFQKALISSDDCLHDVDDADMAAQRTAGILVRTGCRDAACLRALPPQALLDAGGGAAPVVEEGGLLPRLPIAQIHSGDWLRMPLLIGANAEEGRIIGDAASRMNEQAYRDWLAQVAGPSQAARIAARYADLGQGRHFSVAERMSAILTDSGMRGLGGCTILQAARSAVRTAPVFFYEFQGDGPAPDGPRFQHGAAHAVEVALLWEGQAAASQRPAPQRQLAASMLAQWSRFVRADPRQVDMWPQDAMFQFRTGSAGSTAPLAEYRSRHRCDFWDAMPPLMQRGDL